MRYAILSDVHGNLPALEAVLRDVATQETAAMLYLGDAVGYYSDSSAVISLIEDHLRPLECRSDDVSATVRPWVAGNHEWGLLGHLDDHQFSHSALMTLQRTRADLPADQKHLLDQLPQRIEIELADELQVTLVHASPSDPIGATGSSYIENSQDVAIVDQNFNTGICLVGHTHYPRVFHEADTVMQGYAEWAVIDVFEEMLPGGCYHFGAERLILNAGSVGQPRDGDPRASYAILDTAARTFTIRRIAYDVARTQTRVRNWLADAPVELLDGNGGLAERLARGI